jgi:O-antigen ligase
VLALTLWPPLVPSLKNAIMLGRDPSTSDSFSGRTELWEDVIYYIHRRPILGYGYGGFWTPTRTREISDNGQWGVPDSHSAYLDSALALGPLGLLLYVLLLIAGITNAFRRHRHSPNPVSPFCGALLVFCALDGLLESAVVEPSLPMFLCMVALAHLALVSVRMRPKAYDNGICDKQQRGTMVNNSIRCAGDLGSL